MAIQDTLGTLFKSGFEMAQPLLQNQVLKRLRVFLPKPMKVMMVLQMSYKKAGEPASLNHIANDLFDKTKLLGEFIKAYYNGEYREIELMNIAKITAAIAYFASPIDLIPDAIPIIGFFDDVTIMLWLFETLNEELEAFETWKTDT